VSDKLATQVFCLPMHHDLNDEHFGIVEAALVKVANAKR
jgi:dTDP-4-amino-4,6-dideoxygalactose transaminase